jgi:flagellar basal-body rod protein FlgF
MDTAIYVGLSRQLTLQRALEISANNLANVDTAGFKVETLMINTDLFGTPDPSAPKVNYVLDVGVGRSFAPGPMTVTGNPLDLAVEGDGFFAVNTANGPMYTRDGQFTVGVDGTLVDRNGHAVQGAGGGPLQLDNKKSPPSIGRDGTVTQDGVQVGRISVVRFANRSALSKQGSNLYAADAANPPLPANDSLVRQGAVEGSNVTAITEVTNLITISRAYERLTQIMNSTSDLSRQAVNTLGKVV